ncbi:MAG: UDP-N-acetylmuramate--L-alanine ligase [Acidimicrobiia bacterium]|nr:UDP-N-acetylmuramate--L-alanine ligase [Acidimicrobiia bacterium]
MSEELDLSTPGRRVHVVGIAGAGMSAIATVLVQMGHAVTGSDLADSPVLAPLRQLGITISIGHDRANIGHAEIVTRSTAVPSDNVEIIAATEAGLPVLNRTDFLPAITRQKRAIAVGGTHGKTTTSSMLALALDAAGTAPSFIIGSTVTGLDATARWEPAGEWLIVEADESDGSFLGIDRQAAIITSVEPDHLSYYGSEAELRDGFSTFASATDGPVITCADDPGAGFVNPGSNSRVTYGFDERADVRILDFEGGRSTSSFALALGGRVHPLTLAVPGRYNAQNAAAAFAVATAIGLDAGEVVTGLERYRGVARRFELRGDAAGVTFVDDYAHLPTEVEAALSAARDGGWDRVVAVFQPHRYTRTSALWSTFGDAFVGADVVVVTGIYAAGEKPIEGVSGRLIVDAVAERHPASRVAYVHDREALTSHLLSELHTGDLCLTLGAGDLTTLPDDLMARLEVQR